MSNLSTLPYPVIIKEKAIESFPVETTGYSSIFILTDESVASLWASKLEAGLKRNATRIILPAGERYKNLDTSVLAWKELLKQGADRKSLIINLGGGVIGDLGGFVASCYMRGIDFIQVPTTLLSQVDASVGGKLGIDFEGAKNLIGSFRQPKAVVIDISTLESLPIRELASGMAEVVKHGLIAQPVLLQQVSALHSLQDFQKQAQALVSQAVEVKAVVVQEDPQEFGKRKILNFGHTIGHALESFFLPTSKRLLHGEAIALGMLAELRLGELLGCTQGNLRPQLRALLPRLQLPVQVPDRLDLSAILGFMRHDKKNAAGVLNFSIPSDLGNCSYDIHAEPQQVSEALQCLL